MSADAVVLLGFGGPESPAEVRPFLDRVLAARPVSSERYEAVVAHYERIGGASPFNELTRRQARALRAALRERGIDLPVEVGYLHAEPAIETTAERLRLAGNTALMGVILSTLQTTASWDRYQRLPPGSHYAPPFFDHPLFLRAYAQRARDALQRLELPGFDEVALIFTAHSIPVALAAQGPYETQFAHAAKAIALMLDARQWQVAYQSRSGGAEPWLGPDVGEVLDSLAQSGTRNAVIVPLGFTCDHVEVLYDLDVAAADRALAAGVRMQRAAALNDHPLFIEMLAGFVCACASP